MNTLLPKSLLSWVGLCIYLVLEVFGVALILAVGDEPGHPLLALTCDLVFTLLLLWTVLQLQPQQRSRALIIGIPAGLACLLAFYVFSKLLGDGGIAGDLNTPENVQEVKTYFTYLLCLQGAKLLFLAWSAFQGRRRSLVSPQAG